MGKSERLRFRDVRAIYLLLGECCELGADPLIWRAHMLDRLSRLLGAQIAISGTVIPPRNGAAMALVPDSFVDLGWATEGDRNLYLQWLRETPPDIDPVVCHMARTVSQRHESLTCRRCDVLGDAEWYGSAFYNEFYRTSCLDDRLESFFWHAASRLIDGICLIRPCEASAFNVSGRKLLRVFHREVCRILGTKLANSSDPSVASLTPRLRQVLTCLLEGDSEKQVATRLGVSRHTVHEHVKRLHQHFGVASRGELLSRSCRFLPALRKLNGADFTRESNSAVRAFGDAFKIR